MDKNMFNIVEPDYEPLTEREEAGVLAAALAKAGGAGEAESAAEDARGVPEKRMRPTGTKTRFGSDNARGKGRGKHGRRIFVIAIAAVLAFSAVAFASSVIDPDSPLLTLFDPNGKPPGENEIQLAQASGTVIDKTFEKNGLKVHVKEAIGDRDTVYLLIDVTPPEEAIEPGAEYTFERVDLRKKTILPYGGGSWSFEAGELTKDGTIPFIMSANAEGGVIGTFTLDLKNLQRASKEDLDRIEEQAAANEAANPDEPELVTEMGLLEIDGETIEYSKTTDEDGNIVEYTTKPSITGILESESYDNPFKTIVEDDWKVTFKLDYKDNSKDLNIDENITIDGASYRLHDVRVSPISFSYALEGEAVAEADVTEGAADPLFDLPVLIRLKNGAEYDYRQEEVGGSAGRRGSTFHRVVQFPRIIDPAQIESISIDGHEVKP